MRTIQDMLGRMTEWVWAPERKTKGWVLCRTPGLLPEDEDDGQDTELEVC